MPLSGLVSYSLPQPSVFHIWCNQRARGADYGFALAGIIVLALIIKYPFFEFGPRYTAATGGSLIDGYKRVGTPALVLFLALTFATMFSTQAAVTIVTAALASNLFPFELSIGAWSVLILGIIAALLILGRYPWLDKTIKVLMLLLFVATAAATILAARDPGPAVTEAPVIWNAAGIAFIVALVGWMPTPLEGSVWHSLWSVGRREQTGYAPPLREARLDFHIGYVLTGLVALMFLSLGAWVMFGIGESFPENSVAFTQQLIHVYTTVLGEWTWSIVAFAALATMFSTTLAVSDAYARIWAAAPSKS